jgi:AP-2 complex subunit sigma-1
MQSFFSVNVVANDITAMILAPVDETVSAATRGFPQFYFYPLLCLCFPWAKIRFFLLQNRQGKTRLSKWYIPPPTTSSTGTATTAELEKTRIEAEVHRLVTARDKKYTNFIEYNNYKIIYRRYAGLFFTIAVDVQDNELSYLETIHLFVELLDAYFSNVCELDIVFNFNKVYSILDEFMLAGEVEETSKREILDRVKFLEKME